MGRTAALSRAPVGPGIPVRLDAARARGDAARARDRSRLAGERPPRPRAATLEEPARVLLADRGPRQGDARDPADRRARRLGGALPRSRPYRALRAHVP